MQQQRSQPATVNRSVAVHHLPAETERRQKRVGGAQSNVDSTLMAPITAAEPNAPPASPTEPLELLGSDSGAGVGQSSQDHRLADHGIVNSKPDAAALLDAEDKAPTTEPVSVQASN